MPHPILIILHQEHSTPGRLGHALQQRGYTLDVRRPRFGEALPPTMAEHAGAIIFGGPIRCGRAFALQFHPEVTHAMMHLWTTRGHERMELPGARPRHTHFADRAVYDYSARAWLSVFLERWLGG